MPDPLITLRGVSKTYGIEPLFSDLDLAVHDGDRLALIGANGSGKSSLLGILAGTIAPDAGERSVRRGCEIQHVPQEEDLPPASTAVEILDAELAARELPMHEITKRSDRLLRLLAWPDREQPVAELSGGWRKRLSIARRLITEPDVLLLDEPTNHLDLEAVWWLEGLIADWRGTVVMVSHDRWFLDRCATRTVEIGTHFADGIFAASCGYRAFVERRDEFLAGERERHASLANKMRREEAWLAKRPKARTTKSVARIREAEDLREDLQALGRRTAERQRVGIDFATSGRRTQDLIVAEGIGKSFGDRRIFSDLDVHLGPGDRLGLVGGNGSGKSTLMAVLGKELAPDTGRVRHAHDLAIARFEQGRTSLRPAQTLRAHFCPAGGDKVVAPAGAMHINGWAKRFLFRPDQLDQSVGSLSGGEQARLLIALLMMRPADILLLDEPTNDLDIPALEVLEENLLHFLGAVVLITHDRYLLDGVCTSLVALDGRGGAEAVGDYGQWEQRRQAAEASAPADEQQTEATVATPHESDRPGLSWDEQKELRGIEGRIAKAEERLAAIDAKLADPAVFTDPVRVAELTPARETAQTQVDELYARWEDLESRREG